MDRINQILSNALYQSALEKNEEAELERIFCKHGINHLLHVARIAYIIALEDKLPLAKDVIYGAALLHDIGRFMEYEGGPTHETASGQLAKEILEASGYSFDESRVIISAIEKHRQKSDEENSLNQLLYQADKLSRNCFLCKENARCNWSEDKKNKGIIL